MFCSEVEPGRKETGYITELEERETGWLTDWPTALFSILDAELAWRVLDIFKFYILIFGHNVFQIKKNGQKSII